VWFLWFLPVFIVLAAGVALAFAMYLSAGAAVSNLVLLLLLLLLLLVEFVLFVAVMLFGILGAVRFARSGSIREGIRYSQIIVRIRTMGWLSYILSLIALVVAAVIYGIITAVLSLIPFIGWVFVLIITPFFTIFTARYFALVYEQGEPQSVPAKPAE
jgi:hypothetical protein